MVQYSCFTRIIFASFILLTACRRQIDDSTSTPTIQPTVTAKPSPTVIPTATTTTININAKEQPVNCRFGPGVVFEVVGGLRTRQSAQAVGRTSDNAWLYIRDPGNPGGHCWVAASAVEINGKADSLSVVNAPVVTVTRLEVGAEPPRIVVSCSAFPQVFSFTADITTNGPTVVTWRWEVSTGDVAPEQTLIFESAGTKTVREFYRVNGPNDYKVRIHVFSPNDTFAEANFFAVCTP